MAKLVYIVEFFSPTMHRRTRFFCGRARARVENDLCLFTLTLSYRIAKLFYINRISRLNYAISRFSLKVTQC